jgi:DNA-binding SARP family transcriptional activator
MTGDRSPEPEYVAARRVLLGVRAATVGVVHKAVGYASWVVANARKFEEVKLDVKGATAEELAASLVAEMIRTGLTTKG